MWIFELATSAEHGFFFFANRVLGKKTIFEHFDNSNNDNRAAQKN